MVYIVLDKAGKYLDIFTSLKVAEVSLGITYGDQIPCYNTVGTGKVSAVLPNGDTYYILEILPKDCPDHL